MRLPRAPLNCTLAQRLAHSSERRGGCIIWAGSTHPFGYGRLRWNNKVAYAHRLAWIDAKGPIPEETPFVLHTCDVPACLNVEHLFLGTQADNGADMARKGRAKAGGYCRLSDSDVQAIREDTRLQSVIGAAYGVHPAHISKIKSGKTR